MKTLKTIQTLANVGRILSKIVFICCIVGACGCVVGLISMTVGAKTISLGGVTIEGIIKGETGIGMESIYLAVGVGLIVCAGEAVLARFAEIYFKNELADGTPFTFRGAKELLRLGILAICIPVGTGVIAGIAQSVTSKLVGYGEHISIDNSGAVTLGIMFIVGSLLCKHAAEVITGNMAE